MLQKEEIGPLVSVITIVYNGESHIEETIQSVIGQTYKNIEYIIVDGGSTDNTVSIIKKYEQHLAFWVSEKDKGISDAFNKGIQKTNGEIIGIINADDWFEKDCIKNVVDKSGYADIIYGDMRFWKGREVDFVLKGDDTRLLFEMTINHPTVFVKRKCYDQFGGFDEQYKCAMDYDLMLRFKVNQCKFIHVPMVLTNMRWGGLSDNNWLLGCRETLAIKNKYLPDRKLQNGLYFYKHVLAILITKFLASVGFGFLVRFYRQRYSKIKKVYE